VNGYSIGWIRKRPSPMLLYSLLGGHPSIVWESLRKNATLHGKLEAYPYPPLRREDTRIYDLSARIERRHGMVVRHWFDTAVLSGTAWNNVERYTHFDLSPSTVRASNNSAFLLRRFGSEKGIWCIDFDLQGHPELALESCKAVKMMSQMDDDDDEGSC
jgi:hypothetical protein